MARHRKSRYQRQQDDAAKRYRATVSLVHRAERLVMKALEADEAGRKLAHYPDRATLTNKQYSLVNRAAWALRDALRR